MNRDQLLATIILGSLVAIVGWSYWSGGVFYVLLDPGLDSAAKVESLRVLFNSWGPLAPLAYILLVIIEATGPDLSGPVAS